VVGPTPSSLYDRGPVFEKDQIVRMIGTTAIFKVVRIRPEGDVDVYGGKAGHYMSRTLSPDKLRPLTKAELRTYGSRF
jgi:hypothetical protein